MCLLVINSKRAHYKKLLIFVFIILGADVVEELHRIAFRFVRISEVLLVCVCVYIGAVIRNGPWHLIQPVTLSLIIC